MITLVYSKRVSLRNNLLHSVHIYYGLYAYVFGSACLIGSATLIGSARLPDFEKRSYPAHLLGSAQLRNFL